MTTFMLTQCYRPKAFAFAVRRWRIVGNIVVCTYGEVWFFTPTTAPTGCWQIEHNIIM